MWTFMKVQNLDRFMKDHRGTLVMLCIRSQNCLLYLSSLNYVKIVWRELGIFINDYCNKVLSLKWYHMSIAYKMCIIIMIVYLSQVKNFRMRKK